MGDLMLLTREVHNAWVGGSGIETATLISIPPGSGLRLCAYCGRVRVDCEMSRESLNPICPRCKAHYGHETRPYEPPKHIDWPPPIPRFVPPVVCWTDWRRESACWSRSATVQANCYETLEIVAAWWPDGSWTADIWIGNDALAQEESEEAADKSVPVFVCERLLEQVLKYRAEHGCCWGFKSLDKQEVPA